MQGTDTRICHEPHGLQGKGMPAMPIVNILCSAADTAAVTPVCRQSRLTEQNGNLTVDLKLHAHATSEQQAKSSKLESFTSTMSVD